MARAVLKVVAAIAAVCVAAYLLFGTGGPESDDAVTVTFWGAYEEWQMWKEIAAAFQQEYPGERVRLEYWMGGRYEDKVKIRLASGTPPDVMLFQDEPFPPFCQFGKFQDLTEFLTTPGLEVDLDSQYWPTSVESFRWKGRQFGLPIWGGNNLIFINLDLFERLGVPVPAEDWTLDDFLDTARRLTGDDDGDGRIDHYGFMMPYWVYLLPFIYAHGARFLNCDGTRFPDSDAARWEFTGPEAVASLRFAQDLVWKHHVAPRAGEAVQMGEGVMFMTGRLGMFTSGPWAMPFLNRTDMRWDVVHVPRGPGGRATRVTWDALVMAADSPRKDRAWRLMRFCVSRRAQEIVARTQRSVPALRAAQDAFTNANPRVHVRRFIEAMQYSRLQPITDKWERMSQELTPEFDSLLIRRQDPEETVRRIAQRQAALFQPREAAP